MNKEAKAMADASTLCRTLTTFITLLQSHIDPPTSGEVSSANDHVYYHIATLLTRGVEDGGAGRQVIAVTGTNTVNVASIIVLSAATEFQSSSPPLDETLSMPYMTFTHNYPKNGRFTNEAVVPSSQSLEEILENLNATQGVKLKDHVAHVMTAIMSAQKVDKTSEAFFDLRAMALELVLRRSFLKIRHRVLSIKWIYPQGILKRLQDWVPYSEEVLQLAGVGHPEILLPGFTKEGEVWVLIPDANKPYFDQVPTISHDSQLFFQLNIQTTPKLVKILVRLYEDLTNKLSEYKEDDDDSVYDYIFSVQTLYLWLYQFSDFLAVIFRLPSMHALLAASRTKTGQPEGPVVSAETRETEDKEEQSENEADAVAEYRVGLDEDEGKIFIRFLRTIVAWNRAVYRLHGSKLFRSGLDFKLNLIHAPPPGEMKILSLAELLQKLQPALNRYSDEDKAKILERAHATNLPPHFGGTVHCEAILMGLTVAVQSHHPGLPPESNFEELLQETNGIIGVATKCCWMCHCLAKKLKDSNLATFGLSGTTGVMFAWAPPFGIPIGILNEINNDLITILLKSLLNQASNNYRSTQSSPSSDSLDVGFTNTPEMNALQKRRNRAKLRGI